MQTIQGGWPSIEASHYAHVNSNEPDASTDRYTYARDGCSRSTIYKISRQKKKEKKTEHSPPTVTYIFTVAPVQTVVSTLWVKFNSAYDLMFELLFVDDFIAWNVTLENWAYIVQNIELWILISFIINVLLETVSDFKIYLTTLCEIWRKLGLYCCDSRIFCFSILVLENFKEYREFFLKIATKNVTMPCLNVRNFQTIENNPKKCDTIKIWRCDFKLRFWTLSFKNKFYRWNIEWLYFSVISQ